MGHVTLATSLSGMICYHQAGAYYDPSILHTKSEVSIFTHYEHKNSDATYRKCGCLVTQDHWNVTIRYSAYDFLFTFNRNYVSIMYHLQDAVSFFVESRRFHLPHLHLPPSLGVTPFEFQDNLWNQKTRVPGLSRGAVYIIQCSAVLIQYQNMTDIQTDRMTAYTTQSELTLQKPSLYNCRVSCTTAWQM